MGFSFLILSLLLTACSPFTSPKPPVILVLLESFSEKDFLCSEIKQLEGLDSLNSECEKFNRFTHAFAPSSMTQPAIATLFSGKELNEHGVIHNGSIALSGQMQTLAEVALNSGMRTALFSGGIPLLPKFGIRQGFEVYNDSFGYNKNFIFRPFYKSLLRSIKWLDAELGHRSFFMTYYVPDLLYSDLETRDNLGEARPRNRQAQIQEVYETLNQFIVMLKKRKKWENSHIIILGINGDQESLVPINPLGSQSLHVALQIKLAKGTQSNIETLKGNIVSFSQLGKIIEQIILQKPSQGIFNFPTMPEGTLIPQVSHWKKWLKLTNWPDIGLRKKQFLFAWSPNLHIYDSFIDKKEAEPLVKDLAQKVLDEYNLNPLLLQHFDHECYDASFLQEGWKSSKEGCQEPKENLTLVRDMTLITQWADLIESPLDTTDSLSQVVSKALNENDSIVLGWLAQESLYQKKWVNLFELGHQTKNKSWMLVSQINLREPPTFVVSDCLKYFTDEQLKTENFYKHCQDSGLRKIVEGIRQLRSKKRPADSFWDQVSDIKNQRRAKRVNVKIKFLNDIREPFEFQPSLAELYFFLPENSEFQKLIQMDKP